MTYPNFPAGTVPTAGQLNALGIGAAKLSVGTGGANSTAEFVMGTLPNFALGGSLVAGEGFSVRVTGTVATGTTTNLTVRTRLDSVTGAVVSSSGAVSFTAGSGVWSQDGWFYVTSTGTGGLLTASSLFILGVNIPPNIMAGVAIDTTATHSLVVTGQFSVSNAGNVAATTAGSMDMI